MILRRRRSVFSVKSVRSFGVRELQGTGVAGSWDIGGKRIRDFDAATGVLHAGVTYKAVGTWASFYVVPRFVNLPVGFHELPRRRNWAVSLGTA
jgi:hypothetical protein